MIAAAALGGCGEERPANPAPGRGLIILGIDGMDPLLARRFIAAGRMPNLAALIEKGSGMVNMETTFPPQSPVAWSAFITGHGSDEHGIYDFVHRDPQRLEPYLSTSRVEDADQLSVGSLNLSLGSPEVVLLREGRAFWQDLEAAGVPATMVKIPSNFPPAPSHEARSLSGMGTPDLLGTYGTFQFFTNDPALVGAKMSGGIVAALEFVGQKAGAVLQGPGNPLSAAGDAMSLPVEVIVDRRRPVALIRLGDSQLILQPGEWSQWLRISFDPGLLAPAVPGMVRFYLSALEPHVRLYASPINFDPHDAAMPISSPSSYAERLADDVGRFYTQGMPLDTKALVAGALSDDEFLEQVELVVGERFELLDRELDHFDGGLLFFYFGFLDQLCHVYWREMEEGDGPHADVIADAFERADKAIGEVIERAGANTEVLVLSDHGFTAYRRQVHLNSWLARRGYLAVLGQEQVVPGVLGHIDWERTQAYALGLNQLFINLRGREANGVVAPARRDLLLRRLSEALRSWRDPDTGAPVISRVVSPDPANFPARAPDLLIGYNRGYRSSDESALGRVTATEIEPNTGKWSGDHCMDPVHVPGLLVSTGKLAVERAALVDVAPTVLDYFGLEDAAQALPGTPLLAP